jgi:hypothetical protein
MWQNSRVEAVPNSHLATLRAPIGGRRAAATALKDQAKLEAGTVVPCVVNSRSDRTQLDDLRRQKRCLENKRLSVAAKLATAQFRGGRALQLEARIAEIQTSIQPRCRRHRSRLHRPASLVDAFMSWTGVYFAKMFGLVVSWLFLLFGIKAVQADLAELLQFFLPFYVWHGLTMAWLSDGRSLAMMPDVSQLVAVPAVLKAVTTGLLKPKGRNFKVTAKGGERDRKFVKWPLLSLYGTALLIRLAAIAYHPAPCAAKALPMAGWRWPGASTTRSSLPWSASFASSSRARSASFIRRRSCCARAASRISRGSPTSPARG